MLPLVRTGEPEARGRTGTGSADRHRARHAKGDGFSQVLIDLHTHTRPGSADSLLDPDELIERSKQAGLDAIVLSEHDWAWEPEALRELEKRHDFQIIGGLEVSTEGGHILVYGVHHYVDEMRQSETLAASVRRAGGLMVAAHPYRGHAPWNWLSDEDIQNGLSRAEHNPAYRLVEAVEVINGHGSARENWFSEQLAVRLNLPGTAGTDSHQASDIGKAATYFERDIRDERELMAEIAAGRCWPVDLTRGALTDDPARHSIPDGAAIGSRIDDPAAEGKR